VVIAALRCIRGGVALGARRVVHAGALVVGQIVLMFVSQAWVDPRSLAILGIACAYALGSYGVALARAGEGAPLPVSVPLGAAATFGVVSMARGDGVL
jgi:hypothetical protein